LAGRKEEAEELPEEFWNDIQILGKNMEREVSPFAALSKEILKIKNQSVRLQCYLLLLILRELRKRSS